MKPDQLFCDLKAAAEKLGITVSEKSFRNIGINVESGLCTVRGKKVYILDRNKTLHEKNQLLGSCLAGLPNDHIFMVPFTREFIDSLKPGE
jgi:hypothetical protein